MSENTQNNTPKKEQYSLNDDRRVKVLSPGALVAKRFLRPGPAVLHLHPDVQRVCGCDPQR